MIAAVNYRRPHPRHHPATGRERSSRWRYRVVERSHSGRGSHSQRRQLPVVHLDTYHGSYRIVGVRLLFEQEPAED